MCTRAFISSKDYSACATARNMDWVIRFETNLWAFQSGIERLAWEDDKIVTRPSQYNSITAGVSINNKTPEDPLEIITTDGINSAGLAANLLWLKESNYIEKNNKDSLSMGVWAQFMLDNYGDVKQAVTEWIDNKIKVYSFTMPEGLGEDGSPVTCHLSLSDSSGGSAIFEFYEDKDLKHPKLHITTNIQGLKGNDEVVVDYAENCNAMTNSPVYSEQQKLNYYWKWNWSKEEPTKDGIAIPYLPGTCTSPDRFARVSHYLDRLEVDENDPEIVPKAFSLVRVASVPLGYEQDEKNPENSHTLWSTVADHTNGKYYYYSTDYPNIVWIDLKSLQFNDSTSALMLQIPDDFEKAKELAGDLTDQMKDVPSDKYKFFLGHPE